MTPARRAALALLAALACACSRPEATAPHEADARSAAVPGAPAAAPIATTGTISAPPPQAAPPPPFDPLSVPVSEVHLPAFPLLKSPEGLVSTFGNDARARNEAFDRQYFIAGRRAVAFEGKVFHDAFPLQNDMRTYSDVEFHRFYGDAIAALGGHLVSEVQYTPEVVDAAGGREVIEQHLYGAGAMSDYRHDSYLLRTAEKQYWIDVSTGGAPEPHGFVVVLERAN